MISPVRADTKIRVSRPDRQRHLKVLFYGSPGAGKTTLAASAQDVEPMQDVLYLDVEAGTLSISERDDIDVVRISSYTQFAKIYEFLRLHCQYKEAKDEEKLKSLNEQIEAPSDKVYNTVVIDSLTEVQKMLMYMLLGIQVGHSNLEVIPDTPEFKEWGQSAEMIRLLIRSFRDLPMHVIIVCAEQEGEDEVKRRIRRPNLPGKLAGEIQGFLDVVGYLATGRGEENEVVRRLFITSGNTFQAKHRFASTDAGYLENPTMKDLWDLQ